MYNFIKDVIIFIKLVLAVAFKFPYRLNETHYHAFHNNAEDVIYVGISKEIRKAVDKLFVELEEESNNEFDKVLITKWHEEYSRLLDEIENGKINQSLLSFLIFSAKNKEEAIGDLMEYNEYMKELGYSKFRRRGTIIAQISLINLSQIKTKIENAFSSAKKIGSWTIIVATISLGLLYVLNSTLWSPTISPMATTVGHEINFSAIQR